MKCIGSVWAYVRSGKTTVKEYKAILYHRRHILTVIFTSRVLVI